MMDMVAIGLSLLGVVAWTWFSLRRINRKIDILLHLLAKPTKKHECSNHTNRKQTNV